MRFERPVKSPRGVPIVPMIPGGKHDDQNMKIMESMPLRSIITSPVEGTRLPHGARQ